MSFENFPDSARLWVFSLNGQIADTDKFQKGIEQFVNAWKAHGSPLTAGVEVIDSQLLMVAADEAYASASGCSIDALNREVSRLAGEAGLTVCGGGEVIFKMGESWKAVSRAEFQQLMTSKVVDRNTLVVDATLTSVGDLRSKGVVKPLKDSWHSKAFQH